MATAILLARPDSILINLKKGGTSIACGSSLTPGDTGLTFEVSGQGSQYVVEAIASAGMGSWGIQGGDCLNRRQINTVSNTYTVPGSGTVTVRVAGASAKGPVAVSPDCVNTVTAASTPKPPSSSTPSSPSYLQVIPSSPSASPPSSKTSTSKSTRNAISMILSYLLLHLLLAVIIYSYQ